MSTRYRNAGQVLCAAAIFTSFAVLLAACGGSVSISSTPPSSPTPTPTPTPTGMPTSQHVVLVMEENQSYSSVVGNMTGMAAPERTDQSRCSGQQLLRRCTPLDPQLLHADDWANPDLRGQLQRKVWDVDNIARRMLSAKVSFKVYAEGIKQGYVGGNTGLYVIRHNPFAMLSDVAGNPQVANQVIQPFSQFTTDAANKALPAFSFIVPDLNDDAHNGTPQAADNWLQSNVIGPLAANPAFQTGGDGLLIVLFDESVDIDLPTEVGTSPVSSGDRSRNPVTSRPPKMPTSTRTCCAPSWRSSASPTLPASPPPHRT